MAKIKYTGPAGFSVMGVGDLESGKTVEVADEVAAGLQHHKWFEVSGLPKKLQTDPEEEEADESD